MIKFIMHANINVLHYIRNQYNFFTKITKQICAGYK